MKRSAVLRKGVMISWLVLGCCVLSGQDHAWWSQNVQWDGISHWREYLTFSPRYLGPNALPVPEQSMGRVFSESTIRLSSNLQWAPGDQTIHPAIYLCYAVPGQRIGFDLYWVPWEWFQTSHTWKTDRQVFHTYYDDRQATGDLVLQTHLQLIQETHHRPGVTLRVGYRFPSSNSVGAARFTDAPGFHIDLSLGKDYSLWSGTWRPVAMLGLLVWQTNLDTHVQNDALLYGAGCIFQRSAWEGKVIIRGYAGYLNNGDHPLLAEAALKRSWKRGQIFLRFQHGMQDRLYNRLELGVGRSLP